MTDREAFLASLRADTAIAPVFADWLDEHGEPELAAILRSEDGPACVAAWVARGDGADFEQVVRLVHSAWLAGLVPPGFAVWWMPPPPVAGDYATPHVCHRQATFVGLDDLPVGEHVYSVLVMRRQRFVRDGRDLEAWAGRCDDCRVALLAVPR